MKKIYYEKVGRKYVPVREYDSDFTDSFRKGTHLVMSYPGGMSCRYDIDPSFAPMIAAGRFAEDAMASAITQAGEIRRSRDKDRQLTTEQLAAWNHLVKVLDDGAKYLEYASAREIAEAGIKAMQDEANKLLENPAVKNAYEHFMLVCQLTKEHENT